MRLITAVLSIVLFAIATPAQRASSATFGTKPNAVAIDAQHPIAQVSVSSLSARTVAFDVRVHRWNQTAGVDVIDAAEIAGAIVVPPIFSIAPYETTLVRVAFREIAAAPQVEQSYRIVMTEISALKDPRPRVIAVPLFVRPASIVGSASYTLQMKGADMATFVVNNATNAHLYLGKLSISVDGKAVYEGNPAVYILAGTARALSLRLSSPLSAQRVALKFETEDGTTQSAEATVVR